MIKYLDDITEFELVDKPLWWQSQGLQETTTGYGAKLRSSKCVKIKNDPKLRRVYITCYSNAGSAWIIYKGEKVYLRS